MDADSHGRSRRHASRDPNSLRILSILRSRPGVSRTEIARQTRLGKATVSVIVQGLIDEGLVCEDTNGAPPATAGRPPVNLSLNATERLSVGLEVTGRECISALTDLYARPLRVLRKPLCEPSVDTVVECLTGSTNELLEGYDRDRLLGVGVGVPGPVDAARQRVIRAENIGWSEVPLGPMLAERLRAPVTVVKRQNAGALGEYWYGVGRSKPNLMYISVAIGIGCGIIIGGRLYEGASGSAGEIGHMAVVDGGRRCKCGSTGCLETVASLPAIRLSAIERIQRGESSCLIDQAHGGLDAVSGEAVLQAATGGDALAAGVVGEAAHYLGMAIANAINVINPVMVILGGAVLDAGDLFLGPVREEVGNRAFSIALDAVEVVPGSLGFRAAAIGAATLVADRFFSPARAAAAGR